MDEFTRLVRAAFDAPLAVHGFAAGQGGLGDDSGMVIFCMSCDDFAERFGGTSIAPDFVRDGECIDLIVDAVRSDRWHAVGARLNNRYLAAPALPRESLEAEVQYLAARILPMLDGTSAAELGPSRLAARVPAVGPTAALRGR